MWQIDDLTLDGDKITEKVGKISLRWPDALGADTEDFTISSRFPISEGTPAQQLTALVTKANQKKDAWIARRTAENNLKPTILAALNP